MQKLYYYTRHEWLGASSRYRSIQYFDLLKENGFFILHRPLFSDFYLKEKYRRKRLVWLIALKCFFLRFIHLLMDCRPGNVFILEKEFFPYFPALFEWVAKKIGVKIIVDFDDAVWHNYDNHRSRLVRYLLSSKHRHVIYSAKAAICGNNYLYDYAKKCNQNNLIIIPTVVPKDKYIKKDINTEIFTVVWIGSPSTSTQVLKIKEQLKSFTKLRKAEIKLIGFDESLKSQLDFDARIVKWDTKTEVDELCCANVGIMPLIDGPFERGKCGFKLVQYMGVGIACIASNVGCNNEIVIHNKSGFIVDKPEDWLNYLLYLYDNPALCKSFGVNGREIFEGGFTVESQLGDYVSFILKVIGA